MKINIIFLIIIIIIIKIKLTNCIKINFNGFNSKDYLINDENENLNYIYPKPKFSTFSTSTNINDSDNFNKPLLVFNKDSNLKFDKFDNWKKSEIKHINEFYKKLFKIYPIEKNIDSNSKYYYKRIYKNKINHDGNGNGGLIKLKIENIKIKKISTISNLEFEKTFNDTIPFGYNENYEIQASHLQIIISGNSKFGIIQALKTLLQSGNMFKFQNEKLLFLFNLPFTIIDKPRLNYRGLLIDTGRYYLSVDYIKQIIDSISLLKLNALHWHITDDQSFPIEIKDYPKLCKNGKNHLGYIHNFIKIQDAHGNHGTGISSSGIKCYNENDIKEIVEYAKLMGVRVIPEIDLPSHSRSWSKGYENLTCSCPNYLKQRVNEINGEYTLSQPLDPSNEFVYKVIESILKTLKSNFPDPFIHLGFDEIPFDCWIENHKLINNMFKISNDLTTPSKYLSYFINRINLIINKLFNNKTILMWEDIIPMLESNDKLKLLNNQHQHQHQLIFQLWKGRDEFDNYLKFVNQSFIYSFGNYLDPSYQACNSFKECLFDQELLIKEFENSKLLIGFESCAWEMIPLGGDSIKSIEKDGHTQHERGYPDRVWSRLLAISEKMWSESSKSFITQISATQKNEIYENSLIRAKKFIKILDLIINNQNLINSTKTINKLI